MGAGGAHLFPGAENRRWPTPTDDEVKKLADLHVFGLWEEVVNSSRSRSDNMQTPNKTKRIQILGRMQ